MSTTTIPQIGDTKKGFVFTENGWQPTAPPKKKRTALKVILALLVLGLLGTIGMVSCLAAGAKSVGDSISQNANKAGGDSNPMTITPGKAFSVDHFDYKAGWKIQKDVLGDLDVKGLKVTNHRDRKDSALVEIKLWKGTEVVALADCTTEPIMPGTTVSPSCTSTDKLPKKYDKVTINDTF